MPFCNSCGEPIPIGAKACRCGSSQLAPPSGLDTGVDRSMSFVPGASRSGVRNEEQRIGLAAGLRDGIDVTSLSANVAVAPTLQRDNAYTTSMGTRMGFDTRCAACNEPLNVTDDCVSSLDKVFHGRCLVCSECKIPLSGTFAERGGKLYCRGCEARVEKEKTKRLEEIKQKEREAGAIRSAMDNDRHLNEMCGKCDTPLGTEEGFRLGDITYHAACFVCTDCGMPFFKGEFVQEARKPYHQNCHKRMFGKVCPKCSKPISGKFVNFQGREMHSECFTCVHCSGSLSGGFAMESNNPVCATCIKKPKALGAVVTGQAHRGFTIDPITGQKKMV
eukprot:comp14487_c0_seq1/m.20937 comp14487_c0_seq1/g.20937  ORF comp14487_c0_seq1/g.20937 comp14487_c0_seq1/m.20937 type:complete len:333 (-) comp14487_c0_seq1:87-1085(-)